MRQFKRNVVKGQEQENIEFDETKFKKIVLVNRAM